MKFFVSIRFAAVVVVCCATIITGSSITTNSNNQDSEVATVDIDTKINEGQTLLLPTAQDTIGGDFPAFISDDHSKEQQLEQLMFTIEHETPALSWPHQHLNREQTHAAAVNKQSSTCSSQTSCKGCTSQNSCGWCSQSNSCIAGSPSGPFSASDCAPAQWTWLSGSCGNIGGGSSNGSQVCDLGCSPESAKHKSGCGYRGALTRTDKWCTIDGEDYCCEDCCRLTDGIVAAIVIVGVVLIAALVFACCCLCPRCPGYQQRQHVRAASRDREMVPMRRQQPPLASANSSQANVHPI